MTRHLLSASALALCIAGPAAAQDLCGGAGAGGQWIGGNEDASDITTADAYREQMALVLGGNAYVSLFSLSNTTDVRIEAAGRGAGDPLIEIFDSAGGIVASDDDSGGNGAARAELSLDAGSYCMSMKSYDDAPMTAFVRIGRAEQEALTTGMTEGGGGDSDAPTGSCAEARPFGEIGTTVSAPVDETGFWSFSLTEPTAISITAENETADPTIVLYDGSDDTLAENDDSNGLNSRIDQATPLPAGDYCVGVRALNDSSLPIDLTISVYDPEAAAAALYAQGEAAPPLDGSIEITALGELPNRMRKDAQVGGEAQWYSFDVSESGMLLVEAIAAGEGDPWLVLYDDLGREISRNDDYDDGLNSLITSRVRAGSYLIGVRQVNTDTQGLIRLVFERYVPAD